MTADELKKIAAKIAKCLALSASDNSSEAEAAKRQAEALIKKYSLTDDQLAAAQVSEQHAKTGGKTRPPLHLCQLAKIIADAFGCESIAYWNGWLDSRVTFIGLGIKPELASYTFDVLRRHLNKDRTAYQATLKRYKRENKIRMANLFCHAWLIRIAQQAREFAGSEQERQAIEAYKTQCFGDSLRKEERTTAQLKKNNDWDAYVKGHQAAKDVSLHKPVQSKRGALLQ